MLAEIRRLGVADRVLISSFDHADVARRRPRRPVSGRAFSPRNRFTSPRVMSANSWARTVTTRRLTRSGVRNFES